MTDGPLRIAVLGAGRVGQALGGRWAAAGHSVIYGVRDPGDDRHAGLGTVAGVGDAVLGADAVLVALPWPATQSVLEGTDFGDAVVLDATNPLIDMAIEPRAIAAGSGAALVREWSGSDRVVKAFNTTGAPNMVDPAYPGGTPVMPVAGDDDAARALALGLAADAGFDAVDAGPLAAAADLEHLAMLWIRLAFPMGNGPGIAFALLRR